MKNNDYQNNLVYIVRWIFNFSQIIKISVIILYEHFKLTSDLYVFQGTIVPLTAEGNIVVDGVLASCYADFPQYLAHLTMTPMQRYSNVMEWIFGDDTGFPVCVDSAMNFGKLILPSGQYWIY